MKGARTLLRIYILVNNHFSFWHKAWNFRRRGQPIISTLVRNRYLLYRPPNGWKQFLNNLEVHRLSTVNARRVIVKQVNNSYGEIRELNFKSSFVFGIYKNIENGHTWTHLHTDHKQVHIYTHRIHTCL